MSSIPSFRNEITIAVPAGALWAAMTDPACFIEVDPALTTKFEPCGPLRVGSRIMQTRGQSLDEQSDSGEAPTPDVVVLCTALNHGRSFTVEGEHLFQGNVPFRLLISVELRPTPDGLRLVQHTRIHTPGPLSWLIAWLYAGPAKKMQQGQLERLKRRAEEVLAPAHDDA